MQNGDRYSGKVVSLSADTLVLQSDVAGTLRLPRSGVAQLTLGTNAPTTLAAVPVVTNRPPPASAGVQTNLAPSEMPGALRQLGPNLSQFAGDFFESRQISLCRLPLLSLLRYQTA